METFFDLVVASEVRPSLAVIGDITCTLQTRKSVFHPPDMNLKLTFFTSIEGVASCFLNVLHKLKKEVKAT